MAKRTAQDHVDSILRYLSKMRRLAEILHDRNGAGDYDHAWLIVMQRFYGRYRPVRFPRFATRPSRITPPKPKTAEQALIQRAPLRKIVRRKPQYWQSPNGRSRYTSWTERLACGHSITGVFYADGSPVPAKRKCRACVPAAKVRVLKFPREVSA